MYARLHPVPQREQRKGARKDAPSSHFLGRMPDKEETRTAVSRRIGKMERKRTHKSPYERRSGHERKPEGEAETGEQGAGEQGAGVAACVAQAGFSET